jgi:hypothetical protein
MYRRFCKSTCEEAWKQESVALKHWLIIEEACALFDVDEEVIFALAALQRIRVKKLNKSQVYNKADILSVVKKGGDYGNEWLVQLTNGREVTVYKDEVFII